MSLSGARRGSGSVPASSSSAAARAPIAAARPPTTSAAGLEDDGGDDLLAPLGVGHADHGRLGDGRVGDEHVLDLAGREVLGAADDDVVEAALEEQVAVVVDVAAVVGREPAVVGEHRASEVLAGDLLAADEDLALLAGRARVPVGIADLQLDAGQRPADGSEAGADRRVVAGEGGARGRRGRARRSSSWSRSGRRR